MAVTIGTAGNSANIRAVVDRYVVPIIALAFVLAITVSVMLLSQNTYLALVAAVAGLGLGLATSGEVYREMLHEFHNARKWKQGAEGEMLVGEVLAKLPDTYLVFHDYNPTDRDGKPVSWNVDHIVIGPTGVFVIETKNYSQARVTPAEHNRITRKNVKQVSGNAIDLKKQLVAWSGGALQDQFVQPLLVYTQPKAYVENPFEKYVKVIPLKWLEHDITARTGNDLDPDAIYRIGRVLHSRLPWDRKMESQPELDRFGATSREYKLQRAAERRSAKLTAASDTPVKSAEDSEITEETQPEVCPRCGAPLVKRVATRGDRRGKAFLGCTAYGRSGCRYTFNLEE